MYPFCAVTRERSIENKIVAIEAKRIRIVFLYQIGLEKKWTSPRL